MYLPLRLLRRREHGEAHLCSISSGEPKPLSTVQNEELFASGFPEDTTGGSARLLLVSASAALRSAWRDRLASSTWTVCEAQSGAEALERLLEDSSELMLLDPHLPDLDATEFEAMVRAGCPALQIILLAPPVHTLSPATVRTHLSAPDANGFRSRLTLRPDSASSAEPLSDAPAQKGWYELVGASAAMQRVYRFGRLVAPKDTTVLIQGESGTGKDLLARALHLSSARERQPLVTINCAAIPEALLEAELFGYTKGSFTGAAQARIGRIHAAHGGTLFLDEIGDMPYPLQSKILRFLEQGEVQRLGSSDTLKVDCRVIAATNADLKALVKTGRFREDLYYRLAIFPILLPPLRERKDDIEVLVACFLARFCPGAHLTLEARQLLHAHDWPGNVRELRNVMERASLLAEQRREIGINEILL